MNHSDNLARALRTFEPAHQPYQRKRAKLERVDSPLQKPKKKRSKALMAVVTMFYVWRSV